MPVTSALEEVEAGGLSQIQGQPGQQSKTLSQERRLGRREENFNNYLQILIYMSKLQLAKTIESHKYTKLRITTQMLLFISGIVVKVSPNVRDENIRSHTSLHTNCTHTHTFLNSHTDLCRDFTPHEAPNFAENTLL